ncbi:MAG: universal stress protein [Caldilineaceae bacterium]
MTTNKTLHRVVVPLEISEISAEILPTIHKLFEPEQTELTLLTVARSLHDFITQNASVSAQAGQTAVPSQEDWLAYRQGLEERLYREARHLRAEGYHIRTAVLTGDTVHEIFNFIEKGNFDLLAMAADGSQGISRQVFGNLAEQIARLVAVPMLVVRCNGSSQTETKPNQQPVQTLQTEPSMTLAAATDGSQHSRASVLVATDLDRAFGGKLEVIVTVSERMGAAYDQQVMQAVQELLKDQERPPELTPLVGPADVVLGPYLETHPADLLVVGAFKDRSAGSHANIGITAHRIAEAAPMSVLMVKGHQTKLRRLLVCFAVGDTPVIEQGLRFAKALGAKLDLVHILPSQTDVNPKYMAPEDPALHNVLAQDSRLSAFLQSTIAMLHSQGLDRSALQVWRGDPLKTILSLAERGAYDLLMIGNHSGRNFFHDTLANAVLSYAPISVLVIREPIKKRDK